MDLGTACPRGMIVYDDYGWDTTPGVARYVDTQLPFNDRIVFAQPVTATRS